VLEASQQKQPAKDSKAATARDRGLRVDIVATDYTIPGLVDAIKGHFAAPGA